MDKKVLLEWYAEAGVDEAIDDTSTNYFALLSKASANRVDAAGDPAPAIVSSIQSGQSKPVAAVQSQAAAQTPLHHIPSAAIATARSMADKAQTLEELERTVREFDGCAIKKTASKTVFSDGNPKARVMIIGDAPGAQEDLQGIPFCGPSGQLLDRMFAAIGMDRNTLYISNAVFWRPPGNRQPSPEETSICLPFVEKHIALVAPSLLVLSGGTATTSLMRKDASISRLRGKFYEYSNQYTQKTIPVLLMYHPSYLLQQPSHKRLSWNDLLLIREFLGRNPA
jgi:uracil-DNA glycosylase family 4